MNWMKNVKVGDSLVWNEDPVRGFTQGKLYVVTEITRGDGPNERLVHCVDDDGLQRIRYMKRFVPGVVAKIVEENVWVCIREKKGAVGVVGMAYKAVYESASYLRIEYEGTTVAVLKSRFMKQGIQPVPVVPPKPPADPHPFLTKMIGHMGKGGKMDGVASYAIFRPDPSWHIDDACHARLKGGNGVEGAVTWVASQRVEERYHETYKAYVNWIVFGASIFSQAFLKTAPIDTIMKSGVELDVTKPCSIVYTGAIALRMFHEHKIFREVFHELHTLGFDTEICFLVAHMFKGTDYFQSISDWHGVLGENTTLKAFKAAMNGTPAKQSAKNFNESDSWEGYFCQSKFVGRGDTISKIVKGLPEKYREEKVVWGDKVVSIPQKNASALAVFLTKEYFK